MTIVAALFFVVLALSAAFGWMMLRLVRPAGAQQASLEWLDEFTVEKYAPMERLLRESDYAFLAAQRGFQPAISRRLATERRRIFRDYLRHLRTDFHRLVTLANVMIVHSQQDQTELAAQVWQQRVTFYRGVLAIEMQLALAPVGIRVQGVEELLGSLRGMYSQVHHLTPESLFAA